MYFSLFCQKNLYILYFFNNYLSYKTSIIPPLHSIMGEIMLVNAIIFLIKTKSEIIFIAEADLGGNIPGWVTKQVIKDTAYSLVNLRKVMPAYVKKFEKELKLKVIE